MSRRSQWSVVSMFLLVTLWSVAVSTTSGRLRSLNAGYRRRQFGGIEPTRVWSPTRRHAQCTAFHGHCYSTSACCRGLICAAIADHQGLKPEIPGLCVREKELQPCTDNWDCRPDCRCVELSPGHRHCLPKSASLVALPALEARRQFASLRVAGGLGSTCKTSVDCNSVTGDGSHRLCCQLVRRGRLLPKRMCDRVTAISVCIAP